MVLKVKLIHLNQEHPVDLRTGTEKAGADAAAQALIDRLGRASSLRGMEDFGFESEAGIGSAIDSMFERESELLPEQERHRSAEAGFSVNRNLPMLSRINYGQTEIAKEKARTKSQAFPGFWQTLQSDFAMPYTVPSGRIASSQSSNYTGAEQPNPMLGLLGTLGGAAAGGPFGGAMGKAIFS